MQEYIFLHCLNQIMWGSQDIKGNNIMGAKPSACGAKFLLCPSQWLIVYLLLPAFPPDVAIMEDSNVNNIREVSSQQVARQVCCTVCSDQLELADPNTCRKQSYQVLSVAHITSIPENSRCSHDQRGILKSVRICSARFKWYYMYLYAYNKWTS